MLRAHPEGGGGRGGGLVGGGGETPIGVCGSGSGREVLFKNVLLPITFSCFVVKYHA